MASIGMNQSSASTRKTLEGMMGGIRPHILISLFPRGGVYGGVSFPRQQACSPDTVADRVQGDARERLQTPPCHQTDSYNHSRAAQQRVVRPSIWILSRRNGAK